MATAATPTNVYITQGNGNVGLAWDLMATATGYVVQRSADGITYAGVTGGTVAIPSFLDTTGTTGVTYYYQVSSVNMSGTSGYSTPQSIIASMAGQLALGQVRLQAQQRADIVGSTFVTVPEWNSYINQSAFELYDRLVTIYEDYYMAPKATFNITGTTQFYPLPDGKTSFNDINGNPFTPQPFYKMLGVDCGLSPAGNAWITLKKFPFAHRNRFVFPNVTSTFLGVFNLQYRVVGGNIWFIPTPAANQIIGLWYVPRMTMLVQDTDILDGVSGWTEYVIVDAAIKALQKEESDVAELMAQKMDLIKRIEESASNRDAGEPEVISQVRNWSDRNGGMGGGWDGGFGGY